VKKKEAKQRVGIIFANKITKKQKNGIVNNVETKS